MRPRSALLVVLIEYPGIAGLSLTVVASAEVGEGGGGGGGGRKPGGSAVQRAAAIVPTCLVMLQECINLHLAREESTARAPKEYHQVPLESILSAP